MTKKLLVLVYVIGLLGVVGCASLSRTHSGYLKDYSGFTESVRFSGALVDNRNLAKMNNYNKYIIDPVVIYFADPAKNDAVPQDVAKDVAAFFTSEITKDLQDKYTIVDAPGQGVLRVRIAVTDIIASNPILNISPVTKLTQAGSGGACMEGEAVDSVTGERIAAFIDCRKGSQWNITGGYDEWQYAKDACATWAKSFRDRMDIGYQDIAPDNSGN